MGIVCIAVEFQEGDILFTDEVIKPVCLALRVSQKLYVSVCVVCADVALI